MVDVVKPMIYIGKVKVDLNKEVPKMTISEQIKVLCVRSDISVAELARRLGTTPQNLNGKMKRESFTVAELENIAEAVNSSFERKFVLENGEKI